MPQGSILLLNWEDPFKVQKNKKFHYYKQSNSKIVNLSKKKTFLACLFVDVTGLLSKDEIDILVDGFKDKLKG